MLLFCHKVNFANIGFCLWPEGCLECIFVKHCVLGHKKGLTFLRGTLGFYELLSLQLGSAGAYIGCFGAFATLAGFVLDLLTFV